MPLDIENRFTLNAYELLLLQKILYLLFDELQEPKPNYIKVGKILGVHHQTIKKLFKFGRNTFPSFNKGLLDAIIDKLEKVEDPKTYFNFRSNFPAPSLKNNRSDFIPIAHISDLSETRRTQIINDVNITLSEFFSEKDLSKVYFENLPAEEKKLSHKLVKYYLNTTWYVYFITMEFSTPKIGRIILKIGDNPNKVESIPYKGGEAQAFTGTIEFDENESFLIMNLKTKNDAERWSHVKVDVNTDGRPPIALGQYQNIGIGGYSQHFSNNVFEYIEPEKEASLIPLVLDGNDPEFNQIPTAIQKYLHEAERNYIETPPKIYSLESLSNFVNRTITIKQDKFRKVTIQKEDKVLITSPKYAVSEEIFNKFYTEGIEVLTDYFIKNGDKILEKPKAEPRSAPELPLSIEFYQKRITNCTLFIMFYFHKVPSNCLLELDFAVSQGKPIYLFTDEINNLPISIQNANLPFVNIHSKFQSPKTAAEWFINNIDLLYKS